MSDLLHPAQRWLNIGLLLLKVVSVAFIVASFLYLIGAGLNFAVLGAIRVDAERHGTVLIVGCMLVLFALCLASGALGVRASYDLSRVRVFLFAAVATLAVLVVQVATSYFGVQDSAFGVGFIRGMNLLLCAIAGASAVLAISIERTARGDSAAASAEGQVDADAEAGADAENEGLQPDATSGSDAADVDDARESEVAHDDLSADEGDAAPELADADAEAELADGLSSEAEDAEAKTEGDAELADASGSEGSDAEGKATFGTDPEDDDADSDPADDAATDDPAESDWDEADGEGACDDEALDGANGAGDMMADGEPALESEDAAEADGSSACGDEPDSEPESTVERDASQALEGRDGPTAIAVGRSSAEPEDEGYPSDAPAPHASSSGDYLFQGLTADSDAIAPPRTELPDFKPLEVDPLLFEDDFEARFRNTPVFKDIDDAPLFGDGDASEAGDAASAAEDASEPPARGRHYR